MQHEQLENLRAWFDGYVAGFYGDDDFVNANIELKDKHSRRVCEQMLFLADEMSLDANQKLIAEAVALLHDVGRFEQFVKYRTYNDPRSINHCLLGLEILSEAKVLEDMEPAERRIIEKTIEYHGLKELPGDLDGDTLLLCQLIRDADKIDIFKVVLDYYAEYRDNPAGFRLEVELPDEPEYSKEIVELILNEQRVDYNKLKTWNDMKLLQLSWVYDVNFIATLKRIKEYKYLEMIVEFLPDTSDIRRVAEKIYEYVDQRINQNI